MLLFWFLSPQGKGCGPSFEQTWILNKQGCFVPSLTEIGPDGSGEVEGNMQNS